MEKERIETDLAEPITPPWFAGVYFPVNRDELVRQATRNNAGSGIINQLRRIKDREYFNIEDVLDEIEIS